MKKPIKKIVVVGRDADAWLAAFTLQVSFASPQNSVEVHLIELPSELHKQDFYNVLPSHQVLHKILGANEIALMKASSGLYSVAHRFSDWASPSPPFFHAYDTHGTSLNNVDFFQYWIKARSKGLNVSLEDFSLGVVAAKQGRFILLNDTARTFSKASHGYSFSAISYVQAVSKAALKSGVKHIACEIKSIDVSDGKIHSLTLKDNTIIDADLFIDASGVEGLLISQLENNNYENWSCCLPCDRILVASAPCLEPVPAFSQISAFSEGWVGFFPLLDRTAITAVYSSRYTSSQDVLQKITNNSKMKISDAVESTFSPGARKKHWIGNCIALGNTAVNLEPLDATQLHILHLGLSQLRALFPVDAENMIESALFNEKINSYLINVRDFQVAHYKLNKRFGDLFWDAARNSEIPPSLKDKINLFQSRGVVAMREDETFQEESWTSIFAGHGLIPETYNPLVDKTSEADQIENFQHILKYIATEVEQMPSLQAHVEMN